MVLTVLQFPPNLYIGIGAALGAGVLAYAVRKRLAKVLRGASYKQERVGRGPLFLSSAPLISCS